MFFLMWLYMQDHLWILLCFQAMKKVVLSAGKSSVSSPFKNRLMCHLHALFWRLLMHRISTKVPDACIEEMKTTEIFVNTEPSINTSAKATWFEQTMEDFDWELWHSLEVCLNWHFLSSICLELKWSQSLKFTLRQFNDKVDLIFKYALVNWIF